MKAAQFTQYAPGQYPAPSAAYQVTTAPAQTSMTEMLNAMMPIIMLVMLMGMLTPMLKGLGGAAK